MLCRDSDGIASGLPRQDPLAGVNRGPGSGGRRCVGDDAALRKEVPAVRLKHGARVVGKGIAGKSLVNFSRRQDLVRERVQLARLARALEQLAARSIDVERAGNVQ